MNQNYGNYGDYGIFGWAITKKAKCKRVGTDKQKEGDVQKCREIGMEPPALVAKRAARDVKFYTPPSLNNASKQGAAQSSKGCPVEAVPLDAGKYGVKMAPGGALKEPYSIAGKLYYLTPAGFMSKVAELEAACGGSGTPAAKQAQAGRAVDVMEAQGATSNSMGTLLGVGVVALLGVGVLALVMKRGKKTPTRRAL